MQLPGATTESSFDAIADHANVIWFKRGCPRGYDSEIWREAVMELRQNRPLKKRRAAVAKRLDSGLLFSRAVAAAA